MAESDLPFVMDSIDGLIRVYLSSSNSAFQLKSKSGRKSAFISSFKKERDNVRSPLTDRFLSTCADAGYFCPSTIILVPVWLYQKVMATRSVLLGTLDIS